MKKAALGLLMISLVLLTGCKAEAADRERFDDFRQELVSAPELGFQASLTADFGDSVGEYAMSCSGAWDSLGMELTAPASLAGIRAVSREGDLSLEYEELILSAGEIAPDGLDPVSALPAMLRSMGEGYVSSNWREFQGEERWCVFRISVTDEVSMTLWMDYDTMRPVGAELNYEGATVASCELTGWEMSRGTLD